MEEKNITEESGNIEEEKKETSNPADPICCCIADPCGCYVDPCGCYVDPCCCC
jgi:hypothetical protein